MDSCFKRAFHDRRLLGATTSFSAPPAQHHSSGVFLKAKSSLQFESDGGGDDDLASTVIPAVTVVLEGRSICHRISLHKHGSYRSLAKALRGMFVEEEEEDGEVKLEREKEREREDGDDVDLSNAVPGHLIAYEDIENDLLLAGDLNWNDFVRVAKRIRVLPVKANSRRGRGRV